MTAAISKVCGDIASDSVSKWSFQGKLAACAAAGCSLGTHQQAHTHPMANMGTGGEDPEGDTAVPAHLPLQGLWKITSPSWARHCTNLRTPQTAGKPPTGNNVRIKVLPIGHFLMSASYFWWSLQTRVCTTRLSAANRARSISCPCSSLHHLSLLLSLLTKYKLVFCLLNSSTGF